MPKISIIIPVYNAEAFVDRAIDSCLQQSYSDFELVLVDDGSTDRSRQMMSDYALADPRISVEHTANLGVVKAREHGVECSKGEFLFFMDADDTLPTDALQRLAQMATPEVDMVIGDIKQIEADGSEALIQYGHSGEVPGKEHFDWIVSRHVGFIWGKLIRKTLMDTIWVMPYGATFCEDYIQMIQLSYAARKVVHVGETTYNYIQHPASACNKPVTREVHSDRFANLCAHLANIINTCKMEADSRVKLKVLYLFYGRLYLCSCKVSDLDQDLRSRMRNYMREAEVSSFFRKTDSRHYFMTKAVIGLYPVFSFFFCQYLKRKGRIVA